MTHNRRVLFIASCLSLAVTAFIFVIRGHVGEQIQHSVPVMTAGPDGKLVETAMTSAQLGAISMMAFFGFASSILVASPVLDFVGMKPTLLLACLLQCVGLGVFVTTNSYEVLYWSMLFVGFGNGLVEAVINPLCASEYPERKTQMLNVLHAWWPGGLIIGGLLAYYLFDGIGLGWRVQMGLMIIPAAAYGVMCLSQKFPRTERAAAGISAGEMIKETLRPSFLLLLGVMMLTASAELAPNQWIEQIIKDLAGSSGTMVLVYGSGIMFVLRYFAGPIAHVISPIGMMWASTGITAVGLYLLSGVTSGSEAYLYGTIFYIGVCFMWPTMLGIAAERFPKGGAMTIGFMGFSGQFALGLTIYFIGAWRDEYGSKLAFQLVSVMPVIAFLFFGVWWVRDYMSGGYKAINLVKETGHHQEYDAI